MSVEQMILTLTGNFIGKWIEPINVKSKGQMSLKMQELLSDTLPCWAIP
jgi:hypothetical protein